MPWEETSSDEDNKKEGGDDDNDEHLLNSIRVIIRIRPLLQGESVLQKRAQTSTSGQMLIEKQANTVHLKFDARNKETKSFQFDHVADGEIGQQAFYKSSGISKMVKKGVQGYHATIFAYGQTGAGKTYTMDGYKYIQNKSGSFEPQKDLAIEQNTVGILQRSTTSLMKRLFKQSGDRKISVFVEFIQLYNEKIYDLLNSEMFRKRKENDGYRVVNPDEGLKLKWNKHDVYTVENLMRVECESAEEMLHIFHYGLTNKVMGSHKMNLTSSRSHTIFSVTVE